MDKRATKRCDGGRLSGSRWHCDLDLVPSTLQNFSYIHAPSSNFPRYTTPDVISRVTTWPCSMQSAVCPRAQILPTPSDHGHSFCESLGKQKPRPRSSTYLRLVEKLDRDTDGASELAHIGGESATRRKDSLRKVPESNSTTKKTPLPSNSKQRTEESASLGGATRMKMEGSRGKASFSAKR